MSIIRRVVPMICIVGLLFFLRMKRTGTDTEGTLTSFAKTTGYVGTFSEISDTVMSALETRAGNFPK